MVDLTSDEAEDLARYLDVTRAEMLFARGVILVDGDAEKFLIPEFAAEMGVTLDEHGISSVCSLAGTHFKPYVKFLEALGIPFSFITDWDNERGQKRAAELISIIGTLRKEAELDAFVQWLMDTDEWKDCDARTNKFGIFANADTLEVDLVKGDYEEEIFATLREGGFGETRMARIDGWEADMKTLDCKQFLALFDDNGKDRFA